MTFKIFVQTMKKSWKLTLVLGAAIIGSVLFSLLPAQILRRLVDGVLAGKEGEEIFLLAGVLFLAYLLEQGADLIKNALLAIVGQTLIERLRHEMLAKLNRLDILYFAKESSASICSRFITDVGSVSTLFADGLISMVIDGFKIIGVIAAIAFFSKTLAVIVLILLPIVLGISRLFQKRMRVNEKKNLSELAELNQHIHETLDASLVIHSLNKQAWREAEYRSALEENYATREKVNFYDALYSLLIQIIQAVGVIFIVLAAYQASSDAAISAGTAVASIDLLSRLFSPVEALGNEIQNIQQGLSGLARIDEFLSVQEKPAVSIGKADQILAQGKLEVRFQDVCFSYNDTHPVIEHFNAVFSAPESIVFIGRTGAGKSTLFKLLLGLLKPQQGSVTINGVEVSEIDDNEKRRLFGYAEQQFTFIEGDIRQQISLGDPAVSDEKIAQVLKFVGLDKIVQKLPQGYDTLNPEKDFSAGQRQLLSLARALVYDAPILLLDEVSANLDALTEKKIMELLRQASKERLVFSISHRDLEVLDARAFSL